MKFRNIKRNVTATTITNLREGNNYDQNHYSSSLIDSKLNEVTADLPRGGAKILHGISEENASIIIDYIHAMKT